MTNDSREARLAAARRHMATKNLLSDMLNSTLAQLEALTPQQKERFQRAWAARAERMEQAIIDVEASVYTVEELDAMTQFESSPVGIAMRRKGPQAQTMIFNQLAPLIQAVNAEVLGGQG